jgi:hypothetical protein
VEENLGDEMPSSLLSADGSLIVVRHARGSLNMESLSSQQLHKSFPKTGMIFISSQHQERGGALRFPYFEKYLPIKGSSAIWDSVRSGTHIARHIKWRPFELPSQEIHEIGS